MSAVGPSQRRSDAEVMELLERADAHLALAGESRYVRTQVAAVRAVVAWVDGRAAAPVSGHRGPVDDAVLLAEQRRAVDAERQAMERFEDGAYAGLVGMTISWLRREAGTPTPV